MIRPLPNLRATDGLFGRFAPLAPAAERRYVRRSEKIDMKRGVEIAAFTLSHVVLFVVGTTGFAGYRTQAQFQAAATDPLFRVGTTLSRSRTDTRAGASLDADLSALSSTLRTPIAEVIRLVALLEQDRLNDARVACDALAWPHCDPRTLAEMRKTVSQ